VIDGVGLAGLADVGPWGLVTLFVLLVLFGRLIPRWTHDQRMGDKDERIRHLESMVDKRDEQFEKLLTNGELVIKLLEDLRSEAARRR